MIDGNKMVRYNGPRKNRRKNCLVTLRNGDTIYFGIARCNIKADKYDKHLGHTLALGRAAEAAQAHIHSAMHLSADGNSGVCNANNTRFLLKYFESLR